MTLSFNTPLTACLSVLLLGELPVQASGQDDAGKHWAFLPLQEITPPDKEHHPVDAFVRARLEEAGLRAAPPADARTLMRRLYFDLHGLPPKPGQIAAFDRDPSASKVDDLIDTLLASPRYGERWGQHWLDLVRYADTHGFEVNTERPNAWPYRDYVIRAFNEDLPYDQFILEQLAGDAVGEDAATGFLVASAVLLPGQIGKDEASKRLARQDSLDEMIVATGDSFLGISIGCARCHDHKFDPVSQRDYYTIQAFFAGVDYGERPLRDADNENQRSAVEKEIAVLRNRLADLQPLASTGRTILIDDEDEARTTHLKKKNGHGTNPNGSSRGYRQDPGGTDHVPNLSGGRYTWWDNQPGEDVFTYDPGVTGRFRLWISWGVHGSGVHTRDARYVLDLDGDLKTRDDQSEIATADQFYFAGVSDGQSEKTPLWSGLADAGVHDMGRESRIVLRGGETGTGITADVILLEEDSPHGSHPALRAPVNATKNEEFFAPVSARFVRFTSHRTIDDNRHEPCLDELEIFEAGTDRNVALTGTPSSSGNLSGDPQHQLAHINDGRYGNGHSWISDQQGTGWVEITLEKPVVIDRIVWGRDRDGRFADRLALDYTIEVAESPGEWQTVASSQDRLPQGTPFDAGHALVRNVPMDAPAQLREDVHELARLEEELSKLQAEQMVYAGIFRTPDATHVLDRGNPEQPGERVTAAVPHAFGSLTLPEDAPEQERRLALARWITGEQQHLTARVMVNRVWQHHFGNGLVDTPSDFGRNGAAPSHPRLLDWLAREFIRTGWSLKYLHRLILTSQTYQQSNRIDPRAAEVDAGNRLLWRFPTRRLEAEAIRDSMLAASGQLNLRMGGPGFDFFKTRGGLSGFPPVESFSNDGMRRMIYAHKVRMERVPVFGAFDCPDAGRATPKRSRATTALQALNLFNSDFVYAQAAAFAERLEAEAGASLSTERLVEDAFALALGRSPEQRERESCARVVREHGLTTLCRVLFNSNEFLFMP